jgi:hypothetical protein
MPYDDCSERTDEVNSHLSIVDCVIKQNLDCHIVLGGGVGLERTIHHCGCVIDYTYNFNMHRFNVLDHFILSGTLLDTDFASVAAIHEAKILSDHDPIIVTLKFDSFSTESILR